jgi:tRNA modification GTPase
LPPVIAAVDVQQYGHPILSLAAASGAGIRELEQKILDMTLHQGILEGQNAMLTNTRHIELMRQSQEALHQALETIEDGMPLDCAIVDIRRAWEFLGLITGDAASSDIVTEIFSRFCLGK